MPDWNEFDAYARQRMAAFRVPGMATGFTRGGLPEHLAAYGRISPSGEPTRTDTLFGIGSITKSFTALAILQLEEDGLLSTEDPVARHLQNFRLPGQRKGQDVRLRHLLTHTSGLPPLPALELCLEHPPDGSPPAIGDYGQLMDYLADVDRPLLGPPGTFFSYSNEGYGLLGAVVEATSGQPYSHYVTERILGPLGMSSSTFRNPGADGLAQATELYDMRNLADGTEEIYPSPGWSDAPAMIAAGWLRSTVPDLLRYLGMYLGRGQLGDARLLSAQGIAKMLEPRVETSPGRFYAYGFSVIRDFHGCDMIGHSGGLKGVGADVGFIPELGLAGAALANLMGPAARQAVQGGLAFAMGHQAQPFSCDYPAFALPAGRLSDYLGAYPSGEGETYRTEQRAGELWLDDGTKALRLEPVGDDAFVLRERGDETFVRFWRRDAAVYAVSCGTRMILRRDVL